MASTQRVVVITGAGSGLGRALALEYAGAGWAVVAADLAPETAEATAEAVRQAGQPATAIACDVRDEAQVQAVASATVTEYGGFDCWINNAGIAAAGTVERMPIDQWQRLLDIDLIGVVRGCRAAIPHLKARGGGHIINVASFAGIANPPAMAAYNVAKAGVIALSETLRVELLANRIGVAVACPSFFRTNLLATSRKLAGEDEKAAAPQMEKISARLMDASSFTAEDVARAIHSAMQRGRFLVLMKPDRPRWLIKRASPELFFRLVAKTTAAFVKPPRDG
jgi:NAD(P)-dependent dehydrogenase (short-subunit alcohol dehydrogenase family)